MQPSSTSKMSGGLRRARGFVLTELLLAVGVIALVGGGGFLVYRTLTKDAEATGQTNGIVDFMSKSRETFGLSGGNWTAFTAENLIKLNRIPAQFTKDASKIYDAFGNEVVFAAATAAQGMVSFTMRSPEECSKVTQSVADLAYAAGVGTSGSETAVKTGTTKLDIAQLALGCAAANRVLTLTIR